MFGDGDGAAGGGVAGEGGGAAGDSGGGTLKQAENKRLKKLHRNKAQNLSQKVSPSHKGSHGEQPGGTRYRKRTQKQLDILSRP